MAVSSATAKSGRRRNGLRPAGPSARFSSFSSFPFPDFPSALSDVFFFFRVSDINVRPSGRSKTAFNRAFSVRNGCELSEDACRSSAPELFPKSPFIVSSSLAATRTRIVPVERVRRESRRAAVDRCRDGDAAECAYCHTPPFSGRRPVVQRYGESQNPRSTKNQLSGGKNCVAESRRHSARLTSTAHALPQ